MHEAALARGVAATLRERGLRVSGVRLTVRGGHHHPAEFESELRTHLAAALPDQAEALVALRIDRLESAHFCPTCGAEFASADVSPACPKCGAETLPAIADEQIEIVPLQATP